MQLYQPTITGSLSVSGSINLSGSLTLAGGGTISGTASIATNAITASSADNFTVRNTLTAQTLVVQTITSSVDFVTGSTRFGSIIGNTHVFTGSMAISGGLVVSSTAPELTVSATGVTLGNVITDAHNITGSVGISGSLSGTSATFTNIYTTGNVGIATNSTQAITNGISLTIGDSATQHQPYIALRRNSTGGYWAGINWYDQTTRKSFIEENSNFDLRFGTSNTLALTISSTGAATFSSSVTATQGIFALSTNGGAIGSVRNLTLLNSIEAIGNWSGINFSYSNSGTNFGYIGTVVTSDVSNSVADLVFGVKASNSVTAVTEYMRIKGGGNIGIGTTGPVSKVSISDFSGAALPYLDGTTNSFNFNGYYVGQTNSNNTGIVGGLILQNNTYAVGAYSPTIAFMSRSSTGAYSNTYAAIFGITAGTGGDSNWTIGHLVFQTSNAYGPTERMRIASNGDITWGSPLTSSTKNIYWSEAAGEFQLNGGVGSNSVGATGATLRIGNNTTSARRFWSIQLDGSNQFGTWYYAEGVGWTKVGYQTTGGTWTNSDKRRKENISLLNYGLGEVLQLTPKIFNFKNDEFKKPQMGFIAQDVLPIIPEAVQADIDDTKEYYAMNYSNLVPVLVKAIQELKAEFDTYKATHP